VKGGDTGGTHPETRGERGAREGESKGRGRDFQKVMGKGKTLGKGPHRSGIMGGLFISNKVKVKQSG